MNQQPKPPAGLQARGRALWRDVTDRYQLNPAEGLILHELCRTADILDALHSELVTAQLVVTGSTGQQRPNPLLAARNEAEKTLELLSRRLALPDDLAASKRSRTAAKAAQTRWAANG